MKGKGETRFLLKRVLWGLKKGGEMRLLMPIMVSWASIPPITWCHSTWQGVGWHNNICLFPLADFQREAWHRGEVRRREGKKKKRGRGETGSLRWNEREWESAKREWFKLSQRISGSKVRSFSWMEKWSSKFRREGVWERVQGFSKGVAEIVGAKLMNDNARHISRAERPHQVTVGNASQL